ncbi:aerolysin-like protein [Patiria miniata]|uniref:Jacalin-type lectin domain-containing protein n=1 Tax=Patiria miniata TaxID=46514 RepID=A0A913ZLV8_PATMI|nr:aerolysin-like protein [Patiria miniata]
MSHLVEFSDIDTDIFCTNQASGGSGGSKKEFVKLDKGAVMTKIQAWKEGWRFHGVKMWMSDGTAQLFGSQDGDTSSFSLSNGEMLRDLYIQASGEKSSGGYYRLGGISFRTTKGREWGFFAKNLKEDGKYFYDMPNSGIVCGMFGRCGSDVDCLGFAILNPIEKARLVDVTYPNLGMVQVANTPIVVATSEYRNGTSVEQSYTMSESRTVTTECTWSVTTGLEMTLTVNVSAGVPMVAEVDTGASWTVNGESQHSRSEIITKEQSWSWPVVCPPHTEIRATGSMFQDNIDTEYEGKVHIDLKNGHDYEYNVKGIYEGLNVRQNDLEVVELGPA